MSSGPTTWAPAVRAQAGSAALVVGALAAALVVGTLVTFDVFVALAIVVAAGLAALVVADVGLLPVFLVVTMFVESVSLGSGLRISRVAGVLALLVLAYYLLNGGRAGLRPNLLFALAGGYGFWILASAFWADDSRLVLSTFASFVLAAAYVLSFGVLTRTPRHFEAIFFALAVGSLVFGSIAIVTYLQSHGAARGSGLQGDPNYFAVYQVIALPAALTLATLERRPQRRVLYYGIVVIVVLSVIASLSRTGLVALAAVALATLLLPWRVFFRDRAQKATYVVALVLAAMIAGAVASSTFAGRVDSIVHPYRLNDRGSGRIDLWSAAWHGWKSHPWFGLGAGNFQAHALDLLETTPGVNTQANYVKAGGREVHNAYLESLTELGPLGLGLFLGVICATGAAFVSAGRRARALGEHALERFSLSGLASLLAFALSAFFLSNELGKALWVLVGIAVALDATTRRIASARAGEPARR